jgi:transposase
MPAAIAWPPTRLRAALFDGIITAASMFDGPINIESFLAWMKQFPVPTLRPGDIVAMDNLSSHKKPAIRWAIRSAGAKLFYLPPYSPDLNPIDQAFARLKTLLRKANARTREPLEVAIGQLPKRLPRRNVATSSHRPAGYAST